MKILFINPWFKKYKGDDAFPLGLGYVATAAKQTSWEVKVLDCHIEKIGTEKLKEEIKNYKPNVIGFTVMTPNFKTIIQLLNEIKNKDTIYIAGGAHATFRPEETINNGFDIVVRGEGERTIIELLNAIEKNLSLKDIKGISFKENKKIIHNPDREFEMNLDSLKYPDRKLFPYKKYKIMSLITSRGCPYSCIYCAATKFWRGIVRFRTPENVLEELTELKNLGFKKLRFEDSTFTLNHEHVNKICDLIIKENLDFRWSCESRADTLNKEILEKMQKAGCVLICIGVDSGSQKILDTTKRKMNLDSIIKAFSYTKELGIRTRAYITFGLPGETRESVLESISLLEKIKPDQIMISLATIYPGTELDGKGFIEFPEDWVSKFGGHGIGAKLFIPDTLKREEYKQLAELLYQKVKELRKKV
ncbi:MAG: radical SAM protein [Candidatus Aenigmatarchaeota archaeon]